MTAETRAYVMRRGTNICLVVGVPGSFSLLWTVILFLFYRRCISGVKELSDRYLQVFSKMVDVVACRNGKLCFSYIGRLVFTTLKKT